ncbi:MAG: 3-oxoacyl-ACP reductase FabG [Nitrospinota bacterium]
MKSFEGHNVIVTGGTRGIGRAISESFIKEGANVCALYNANDESAESFKNDIDNQNRLTIAKVDIGSYSSSEQFFNRYAKEHDSLDILVNSAGIRLDSVVGLMPTDNWEKVIATNLSGSFNVSKLAVKIMLKKRYGRIIHLTSPIGNLGFAGQANYAASKAGQVALTKSLSKELAKRNITVNAVSPGFIETDLISDLSADLSKKYLEMIPLKRFGQAAEVARVVLFLAAKESSYITGATYEITGGL